MLDDTRKWWKVKNRFGSEGFVPSNLLEPIIYKKKISGSKCYVVAQVLHNLILILVNNLPLTL